MILYVKIKLLKPKLQYVNLNILIFLVQSLIIFFFLTFSNIKLIYFILFEYLNFEYLSRHYVIYFNNARSRIFFNHFIDFALDFIVLVAR